MRYQFGEFVLLPDLYELRRGADKVAIEPRALEMLVYLVANRGRVVPKDELVEEVWERKFITDSALARAVGKLRKVLDDPASEPRFIQTVYGRGYAFIGELAELPEELDSKEAGSAVGSDLASTGGLSPETSKASNKYSARILVALVLVVGVALVLFASRDEEGDAAAPMPASRDVVGVSVGAPLPSVATLPLRNLTAEAAFAHLQVAVPSEVTMLLHRVPALSVRPFTASLSVVGEHPDPQAAGRELRATYVVGGQYLVAGDELRVTLEATDVGRNALVWSETITVPTSDDIGLMAALEQAVNQGLVPFLGAAVTSAHQAPRPRNLEAYSLYLQALALPQTGNENQRAVAMLDNSVAIDTDYAPAWAELSRRLELDALYGKGGLEVRTRSIAALDRASELDPDLVPTVVRAIMLRTDNGDLEGAFDLAQQLVDRRPGSALARFARGYVYRFAGLLELSAEDCEAALALDPVNPRWRSCAATMGYLGLTERMWDFAELDDEPIWTAITRGFGALGAGDHGEALRYLRKVPEIVYPWHLRARLVEEYLAGSPELAGVAATAIETQRALPTDVEDRFSLATFLVACGLADEGLSMAQWAVEGGFCAAAGLQHPIYDTIRDRPEFEQLLADAEACTQRFHEYRDRTLGDVV